MTGSKFASYDQYYAGREKFSYVVEILYSFCSQHLKQIEGWIDENNQDFCYWYTEGFGPNHIVTVAFVNPNDCFDFKITWG